jgi:hypothetical protein
LLINDASLTDAMTRNRIFSLHFSNNQRAICVLNKIQLDAIDWAILLLRWNMTILMLRVGLATAKTSHSSNHL